MYGNLTSGISLRKCFYLSLIVFVLSTLMAMAIIIKLSPLESVKCQLQDADSTSELTSTPAQLIKINNNDNNLKLINKKYESINYNNKNTNDNNKLSWNMRNKASSLLQIQNQNESTTDIEINYNVHIFYYPWYQSLEYDGAWKHWNHYYLPNWKKNDKRKFPTGHHRPPSDIGANYYPSIGCYSSNDPQVIDLHMRQLRNSGVGVLVVSWTPPNAPDSLDPIMADLLDAAHRYHLKISPHIEPYPDRNPINLIEHLRYLFKRYSSHPALHRAPKKFRGPLLPVIYIYDSYLFPSSAWWELLSERGNLTLRGTELDAIYMGLLVESQHRSHIKKSHFDGFYTYFAINNFSYGSTWKNWKDLNRFAIQNGLIFVPSVGPGYIDTQVRPWNADNIRHRRHGQYYESAWKIVINSGANIVSITSFNEWHEGTQIEPAKPASSKDFTYLDYEPDGEDYYLNLTKQWVQKFTHKQSKFH